ncbi:hypothetical protein J2Z69_001833 [Paenibacillus shirakamiensis]|uniref:Uncharacterized protein n=1 Tax=Paenibacillus shirakamiensis TaxID=1265935 RepID=A0ABS4JGG7_9BACL|nr:hypothetical protein [Paenibacillus shirakamiensis]MBP2000802.1 hypothetical protein [Paenibacillus shirakamiensis]
MRNMWNLLRRTFTLRHTLLLLCTIMVILIAIKGYYIQRKIAWTREAETYYSQKNWVDAETLYQKSKHDGWFHYKDDLVAKRLGELSPITEIKTQLAGLDEITQSVNSDSDTDFTQAIQGYAVLQQLRAKYMDKSTMYSPYYRQISIDYQVTEHYMSAFRSFEQRFLQQSKENLKEASYTDESFRQKLLQIPVAYYGTKEKQLASLTPKFKSYDVQKLTQFTARGQFTDFLKEASVLKRLYLEAKINAPWIHTHVELLANQVLASDLKSSNYAAFATHGKSYAHFVEQEHWRSKVTGYIRTQYTKLLRKAKLMIAKGEYQQAITLYQAIKDYQGTTAEIAAANAAWTKNQPLRLLQTADNTQTFSHVIEGSRLFGYTSYVAAADGTNRIYFAGIDASGQTKIVSSDEFPDGTTIKTISVHNQLSTQLHPMLIIQSSSESRKTHYTAFEVGVNTLDKRFEFEADGFTVQSDGTLLVENPTGEGAGQQVLYTFDGNQYVFQEIHTEYIDIQVNDLLAHANEKVRFTADIILSSEQGPVANLGDGYMLLKYKSDLPIGLLPVSGQFTNQYEEVTVNDEVLSLPVFEVEQTE